MFACLACMTALKQNRLFLVTLHVDHVMKTVWYNIVQYDMIWYDMTWYDNTTLYNSTHKGDLYWTASATYVSCFSGRITYRNSPLPNYCSTAVSLLWHLMFFFSFLILMSVNFRKRRRGKVGQVAASFSANAAASVEWIFTSLLGRQLRDTTIIILETRHHSISLQSFSSFKQPHPQPPISSLHFPMSQVIYVRRGTGQPCESKICQVSVPHSGLRTDVFYLFIHFYLFFDDESPECACVAFHRL